MVCWCWNSQCRKCRKSVFKDQPYYVAFEDFIKILEIKKSITNCNAFFYFEILIITQLWFLTFQRIDQFLVK